MTILSDHLDKKLQSAAVIKTEMSSCPVAAAKCRAGSGGATKDCLQLRHIF